VISFLGVLPVKADLFSCGVNLGATGRTKEWAIFSLGGGVKDSDLTGSSDVFGDVGVAGNGDIDLSSNAAIHGDLCYHTGGTLKKKNNASITGVTHNDLASDTLLNQGVIDAKTGCGWPASRRQ
jgi:hypothetical protein